MKVEITRIKEHRIIHEQVGPEKGLIEGVVIKQLKSWPDDRGHFAEIFRADEPVVADFQILQTSLTMTRPGTIKAFHWHYHQDDVFCPLRGTIRISLVDLRVASPTYGLANSIFCGDRYLKAVRIPCGVAHGYEVLGDEEMTMVYYTNQTYNPKDEGRIAHDDPALGWTWWGVEHR
ncbi:MAG: dTDP-4-dehydrorhamnose 3,5-epimerase family protein [Planctomycetes bacterium]|nr:dTDP-4-dehydrorhamnose 3,5-epimerase family protein [Planctomycetota bacterium]